jgi:hypothetical protein
MRLNHAAVFKKYYLYLRVFEDILSLVLLIYSTESATTFLFNV